MTLEEYDNFFETIVYPIVEDLGFIYTIKAIAHDKGKSSTEHRFSFQLEEDSWASLQLKVMFRGNKAHHFEISLWVNPKEILFYKTAFPSKDDILDCVDKLRKFLTEE